MRNDITPELDLKLGSIYRTIGGLRVFIYKVQLMGNGLAKLYHIHNGKLVKNEAGRFVYDVLSSEITRARIDQGIKENNGEPRTENSIPALFLQNELIYSDEEINKAPSISQVVEKVAELTEIVKKPRKPYTKKQTLDELVDKGLKKQKAITDDFEELLITEATRLRKKLMAIENLIETYREK